MAALRLRSGPLVPSLDRWSHTLGFLALLALHLALAAPLRGPMLFGDEAAYLGIARFLAGHQPTMVMTSPAMGAVPYYSFGYPLLLTPAAWLTEDPLTLYRWALVVNALLLSALFPLLSLLGRDFLGAPPREAALAAGVASVYPAFLLQSCLAWSESLLAPLLVFLFLSFFRLAERPRTGAALRFAVAVVFACAVHSRMLGLAPLALVALGLLWKRGRLHPRAAKSAVIGLLAGLGAVRGIQEQIAARLWLGDPRRFGTAAFAENWLDPTTPLHAALSLVGQLWYLSVASFGLFPLGAVVLARLAWRRESAGPRRETAGFVLAAAGLLVATSAAFLIHFDRADIAIYGRYAEAVLGPFLVAGLLGSSWRVLSVSSRSVLAALPCAGVAILLSGHADAVFQSTLNHVNIFGIVAPILLLGGLRMLRLTAALVAASFALGAIASRWPRVAATLAGASFLVGALWTHQTWLLGANGTGNDATSLPRAVEAIEASAVAYDRAAFTLRGFFGYQFWLTGVRFHDFDSRSEAPPASLVIASKRFGERSSGARLVFPERFEDQALWVLPGPWLNRLAAEGKLIPQDPLSPLPAAACRSRLELASAPRRTLARGEATTLRLRVEHRGGAAAWLPKDALASDWGTVRLGARWRSEEAPDGLLDLGERGELPHAVLPGEAVDVPLTMFARNADGEPLPAATYVVEIGLVQEGVQWFGDAGDPPLRLWVELTP